MENDKVNRIIKRLINNLENGQGMPLSSGKVVVDREEMILMLKELRSVVNGELKVYREVNDKKGRIISEAKKEAEEIINEAKQSASRIRVSKGMPGLGSARLDNLSMEDKEALRTASDIYASSLIYTDEMLTEVNDLLAQAYSYVNSQYSMMMQSLEEKAQSIAENKAELMANLKELSNEERYEQILDLSQLLSNELYTERQRVRALEKKKEERKIAVPRQSGMVANAKVKPRNGEETYVSPFEQLEIRRVEAPEIHITDSVLDKKAEFTKKTADEKAKKAELAKKKTEEKARNPEKLVAATTVEGKQPKAKPEKITAEGFARRLARASASKKEDNNG